METATVATKIIPKKPKIKLDFKDSKYATGRRKRSIAKVWMKKGSGIIHVNGKVRIDRIDHSGIFNVDLKRHTHQLRVIKKII